MSADDRPVALITGTSSGIGHAAARLLAAKGFRVFGAGRTPETGDLPYAWVSLDVRSDASVRTAVDAVLQRAGRIDVLVNNAGYSQFGALEEITPAQLQAQFDTNVFGVLRVTQAVLPGMRARRSGRIINVGSLLGHVAPAFLGAYAGTKFALEGLSEALRAELSPFGIGVSVVEPSFVSTHIGRSDAGEGLEAYRARRRTGAVFLDRGVKRGMPPEAVAEAILAIARAPRPRLRYPVGRIARVIMLLKRVLPGGMFERMRGRMFPAECETRP